jgi:hypothetical protein
VLSSYAQAGGLASSSAAAPDTIANRSGNAIPSSGGANCPVISSAPPRSNIQPHRPIKTRNSGGPLAVRAVADPLAEVALLIPSRHSVTAIAFSEYPASCGSIAKLRRYLTDASARPPHQ